MIPKHLLARTEQWEARFGTWAKQQPEYANVVSCLEYWRNTGDGAGWSDQARRNKQIDTALRTRFEAEVEAHPMQHFVSMTIVS